MLRTLAILTFLSLAISGLSRAQPFVHPGGLHTKDDLDRMKTKVAAKEQPWFEAWNAFVRDPKARDNYKARPAKDMGSRQRAQDDATAMYYNALHWYISGETSHADCAVRIANDWANSVSERPYGDDLSGIPIGSFALAAEVLRVYPGWAKDDFEKFKRMLTDHWYAKSSDFLRNHRGGPVDHCWANWDACNMLAVLGIGVLCDDRGKFNEAVEYFKNGPGMGSIKNAVPFLYPDGLGQWQEAGRDFAHTMGGQGLLSEFCQVAWNQGLDLFGYDDNRLLKGSEYAARYTLWKGVPYTFYTNSDRAMQYYISTNYKGRLDASHFELLYNHYVVRKGIASPDVQRFAELRRPEPGEIDIFGHGTLTFTLDAKASPLATNAPPSPRAVTATAGIGRIELQWPPSGAYTAHGYEISRATSKDGPYQVIYSTRKWTTPAYTDTTVEPGHTYFYTVAALNNAGKSAPSDPVACAPATVRPLPESFRASSVNGVEYSESAGNTFVVPAAGADLSGNFAGQPLDGDFDLTARLVDRRGSVSMMGLTVREAGENPQALAMTLGEIGGRQARFRTRGKDGKTAVQPGNDYTWLPVWFRIRRVGDQFTAFQSPDGIEWYEVGKSTATLARGSLVGLLASGGGNPPGAKKEDAPTAIFDHFNISRSPKALPATVTSLKLAPGGDITTLTWDTNTPSHEGVKVEASTAGGPFYEIADIPAPTTRFDHTGLKKDAPLRYRIRTYNRTGYSLYSPTVP